MKGLEIIFDLDDTTIHNQYMYQMPYANCIGFILDKIKANTKAKKDIEEVKKIITLQGKTCKEIGRIIKDTKCDPVIEEIYRYAWELNLNSVKANPENPFPKERFPTALRETYSEMCKRYKQEHSELEASTVYRLAEEFCNVTYDMVDGAEDTFAFLKGKGESLKILTAGDPWLQAKKIEVNGLGRFFSTENIIIVPTKQNGIILEHIDPGKKDMVYMVGNSMKSDINPTTRAGMKAIYIPCKTWEYEDNSSIEHPERVIVVEKISDIIARYDSL